MNQWTTHVVEYENLLNELKEVGTRAGYALNPESERLEKVVGLMTENLVLAGKRFCPCKQSHPLDPAKDVACPCPEWKSEIETEGHCFCRLFFVRENP